MIYNKWSFLKKKPHQLWYTNNKTENVLSRKHISVYNSLVFAVNLNEKKKFAESAKVSTRLLKLKSWILIEWILSIVRSLFCFNNGYLCKFMPCWGAVCIYFVLTNARSLIKLTSTTYFTNSILKYNKCNLFLCNNFLFYLKPPDTSGYLGFWGKR